MLKFSPSNYTKNQTKFMYNVLLQGVVLNTPDCDGYCMKCPFLNPCQEIHAVLHQIEIHNLYGKNFLNKNLTTKPLDKTEQADV